MNSLDAALDSLDQRVTPGEHTDGRRARRERNREVVIDAYLELLREGDIDPTFDRVSERAGVSTRSAFRYFSNGDELLAAVAARVVSTFRPAHDHDDDLDRPLDERIEGFVASRLDLFEHTAPVTRAARARKPTDTIVQATEAVRAIMRQRISDLFATELRSFDAARRDQIVLALSLAFLFEPLEHAYDQLEDRSLVASMLRRQIRMTLN